ncbi:AI-2E family transporter [Arthrobacter bambusae]|uniref:AI-2E family transporter n=1 Tax=Arthrobacter bambusae TaxID=1338426 RepID=UPI0027864CE5|nr:AI-2E family transporter [Arthrobacter bambusae]MDQ0029285.1 putative PurR-regulated permease PerM [Arthrobacter bambusae]MDQ0098194.1 putative PurR-regulated permease PerM [Arthrobacter bambusae]
MTPAQDATRISDPVSAVPKPVPEHHIAQDIPYGVRIAAAWAWRVGLIMVVGGALIWLLGRVSFLIIPLMVASLLAGLLYPVTRWFGKLKMPRGVAVAVTVVGFLGVVGGALVLVGRQLAVGFGELWQEALAGVQQIQAWLADGPLHLTADQIDTYIQSATSALQTNSSSILSGALSFGSTAGHFAAGMVLSLFILIFFLLEGSRIWRFIVGLLPRNARAAAYGAGRRGWSSMVSYVRIQMFVAFVDAVGIGVGAAIIQVPLALPLGVLVFIGSFIPVVGALVTGAIAVLLALVANGPVNALVMFAIVLFVQQLESHILQPLIMGKAVSLHPVAVILSVAAGSYLAGIPGALFAVPLLAVANTAVRYIAARTWEHDEGLMTAYAGAGIAPTDSDEEPTVKEIHRPGANAGARSNSGEGAAGQHAAAERTFPEDAAQHTNKGD